MKKLVLIDFDHTLFDTEKFKQEAFVDFDHLEVADLNQFLYEDAITFVNYVTHYCQPAIFSEGPMPYQAKKIALTQIATMIPARFTFVFSSHQKNRGLADFLKANSTVALVDDKPEFVDYAGGLNLPTIRVLRGKYAHESTKRLPTFTVASLQSIVDQDLIGKLNS